MRKIIRKILYEDLRQNLIRLRDRKIDRLMCKSLLWAKSRDAKVLGMPRNSKNWGDFWVIKHLARESLSDKILVDVGLSLTSPVSEFYKQKVRHAFQIDYLNKVVPVSGENRLSLFHVDAKNPLPLPDACADIIVGTRAYVCLSSKYQLMQIQEIDRILRPGGKAFITIPYFFNLPESYTSHPKASDHIEPRHHFEKQMDIASILEKLNISPTDEHGDLSLFPGFKCFSEKRVRKIPGLITCTTGDFFDAELNADAPDSSTCCAEIGIVLEKSRLGQKNCYFAPEKFRKNRKHGELNHYETDKLRDVRLDGLLSVFPSLAGKRFLYLYEDGHDFANLLETAGAEVHSCLPSMEAYQKLSSRYPDRKCWIHDLNYPWSLRLSERYDAVFAFGVLDKLSNPKPFLEYAIQLSPVLFIDLPSNIDKTSAKGMIDPIFLKDQMQLLDFDIHLFAATPFCGDHSGAGSKKTAAEEIGLNGNQPPRTMFICTRQRDRLEPLIVHVHMPKAAGQAFEDFLSRNFPDRVKLYYPESPAAVQWDLFKGEIQKGLSPLVFSSQSMSMYFPPILGSHLMLYVSLFRHPYSMIFSYVKYIKKNYEKLSAAHRAILPINLRSMSIEESVQWHIRNGGFFPLPVLELTKGLGVKRAKEIVGRFFFTGIVEEMERSIKLLSIKLEPYGFYLSSLDMPVKNTTKDVDLEGYNFDSDKEFQDFARTELCEEIEFYEWIQERFETEAKSFGI